MLPDASVPGRLKCVGCGAGLVQVQTGGTLTPRGALGLHATSGDAVEGLPRREATRHVDDRGSESGTDVTRTEGGADVRRSASPAGPTRRDPQGERKREEELTAVRSVLSRFNRLHGTSYESVRSGPDAEGVDVIADSRVANEPPINFQLTFADTDGKLRASLSKGQPYATDLPEEELIARFEAAVAKKSSNANPQWVLVLDGYGVVTPPGTVERFARDSSALPQSGFREVWWADASPGGVVRRLWPTETAAT